MKKIMLKKHINLLSESKGFCSLQLIIITMASILLFGYILESVQITTKSFSIREKAIQEQLWGESIYQIADLYVIKEFENIYNESIYEVIENNKDNEIIKLKTLRLTCFQIWGKGVNNVGKKLAKSQMIKDLGFRYIKIEKKPYQYKPLPEEGYFVLTKYVDTKYINTSEDFGITIEISVSKDNQNYKYKKDYIFKIPFYEDKVIEKIKKHTETKADMVILDVDNIVDAGVYYEKIL
ncbi:MAG: hypothetical protein ACRC76_06305 [Proteocatella sp.]